MKLAGGVLLVAAGLGTGAIAAAVIRLTAQIRTGLANVDVYANRVAREALVQEFEPHRQLRLARAMMLIVANETGNRPRPAAGYVGDRGARFGPSVGPMQVYRGTAEEEGLWTRPDGASDAEAAEAYELMAQDDAWGIHAGRRVLVLKLAAAGDDMPDAIRRYNGSGKDAVAYREKAIARAGELGWFEVVT